MIEQTFVFLQFQMLMHTEPTHIRFDQIERFFVDVIAIVIVIVIVMLIDQRLTGGWNDS
jgi:hypothetical protein